MLFFAKSVYFGAKFTQSNGPLTDGDCGPLFYLTVNASEIYPEIAHFEVRISERFSTVPPVKCKVMDSTVSIIHSGR